MHLNNIFFNSNLVKILYNIASVKPDELIIVALTLGIYYNPIKVRNEQ